MCENNGDNYSLSLAKALFKLPIDVFVSFIILFVTGSIGLVVSVHLIAHCFVAGLPEIGSENVHILLWGLVPVISGIYIKVRTFGMKDI